MGKSDAGGASCPPELVDEFHSFPADVIRERRVDDAFDLSFLDPFRRSCLEGHHRLTFDQGFRLRVGISLVVGAELRSRLLEPLGYVPPAEFEKAYHDRQAAPVGMAVLT